MTAFAQSVETLRKTDTQSNNRTVSELVRVGLADFIDYPDIDHTLHGINSETSLSLEANITVSSIREYTCKTCRSPIGLEERHVVVSGICSRRLRDGAVLDHHHLHRDCFHDNELPYWDDITVGPMDKERRQVVLDRIHQIKEKRKSSGLAA